MITAQDLVNNFEILKTDQINPTTGRLHRVRINKKEVCRFYVEGGDAIGSYNYKICGVIKRMVCNTREEAIFKMAQTLEKYFNDTLHVDSISEKLFEQVKLIDENAKMSLVDLDAKSHLRSLEIAHKNITFTYLNHNCSIKIVKRFDKGHDTFVCNYFTYKKGKKKGETIIVTPNNIKSTVKLTIVNDLTGIFD